MKDNWDSLIYIIITIVAFAISAMGKNKKKQAFKPSVGQDPGSEKKETSLFSGIEKLIKEQVGIEDPYSSEKEYFSVNQKEEIVEEKPTNGILDTVPPEMLDDTEDTPYSIEYEDTSDIFKSKIKEEDLTAEEEHPILENFNLRDAVIYSEIINRKEY